MHNKIERQSTKNPEKLRERNMDINEYIAKNMTYFIVDQVSTFGEVGEKLYFVPTNMDFKEHTIHGWNYRLGMCKEYNLSELTEKRCRGKIISAEKDVFYYTNINKLLEAPV